MRTIVRRLCNPPVLLGILLVCRLALLILAPHTDPSESRYAEIARKMVETGDWITPQFDYGVPFWAKPPLSMWMSALGIELFGVNEFGSRIFIFVGALGVLALVADAARRELGKEAGWTAAAVLTGMPLFFYCSAAVMTDLALLLGTTLTMVCFRGAMRGGPRWSGYGVFAGLAIGLLAKGPLALVISLPPIAAWLLITGRWRTAWRSLPWFTGTVVMLLLALPWYLAAERKTPGFLDYFLMGEHWNRFTVRGWQGDLYGNAHPVAPGMIWVYLLLGSFPWCLGLLRARPASWRGFRIWAMAHHGRGLYWILWALWPVAFFTPARNIIATYPLPALPALAILLAEFHGTTTPASLPKPVPRPLSPMLAGITLAFAAWAIVVSLFLPELAPKQSERALIRRFERERSPGDRLIYYGPRKYSSEFYTEGGIDHTVSAGTIAERLDSPGRTFVALPSYWLPLIPPPVRRRLLPVASWGPGPSLYVERTDMPDMSGIDPSRTSPIGN
ncbi:glycosyltransferase family 39 protein [Luteolibacter arcticus]|uniref:Glycosyltransferase family 39 protein n=1 Tax=Luteolibacter arcticus TaxID=1581411 RepID=A0ABT3GG22_9BACT|nr:glycosyltransferase family 39 protein [Luteolibacter arcticus]MCW1922570.1 glycosyltransferase family 39 protein [Luteolibacter arcticus]